MFLRRKSWVRDDTPSSPDYLGTPVEVYGEAGKRVWKRELDIMGVCA